MQHFPSGAAKLPARGDLPWLDLARCQFSAYQVERQFQPVRYSELLENVVEVIFDRLFAYKNFFRDFFVHQSLGDQIRHLLFTLG